MSLFSLLEQQPEVPKFKPTDTTKEQLAAVKGNIANFGEISKLAGSTNTFNQEELNRMLEMGSPGYAAMQESMKARIGSWINGEIPKDVSDQIGRNSAYQSLSGGYGGSGMARNLVARDLGTTSLNLMQKGVDAGSRWLAQSRGSAAPAFDASSMFITPQQRIGVAMADKENKWNRDWLANQQDAAYDWRTILGKGADSMVEGIKGGAASAAGSAAGGGGGGM